MNIAHHTPRQTNRSRYQLAFRYLCVASTVLLLLSGISAYGDQYYWVGGSGSWSEISHWATSSGGSTFHSVVPGPNDTVYFDGHSGFTQGNNRVMINTHATCHTMIWDDAPGNPTLEGAYNMSLTIFGSLQLQEEMVVDLKQSYFTLNFRGGQPGNTIRTMGQDVSAGGISQNGRWTWGGIYFNGSGEWTLLDGFYAGSCEIYLQEGSLRTDGHTLNAHGFRVETPDQKELHLGASEVHIGYRIMIYSFFDLDAGSSVIRFSDDFPEHRFYVYSSGIEFNDVHFANPDVDVATIHGWGNQFNHVVFEGNGELRGQNTFATLEFAPGKAYQLEARRTQTINDDFIARVPVCSTPIMITSTDEGEAAILVKTEGTISCANIALQDIHGEGGAAFVAEGSIDLGNTDGWIITEPVSKRLYWIGGGGDWADGNHWSLASDGAPSGCVPTAADDVVFDDNSFAAGGNHVVEISSPAFCNDMTWDGAPGNPLLRGNEYQSMNIMGSLRLQEAMRVDLASADFRWYFRGRVAENEIETSGHVLNAGYWDWQNNFRGGVYFAGEDTEWVLQDGLSVGQSHIFLQEGVLNTNGHPLSASEFRSETDYSPSILRLGSSTVTIDKIFSIGFSSDFILEAGTSTIAFTDNGLGELQSSDIGYNHVLFEGDGIIRGSNEYNMLEFSPGKSYQLQAGSRQTINDDFIASAPVCTTPIMITSMDEGEAAILVKSDGTISCANIALQDIHGEGDAGFVADGSIDLGNTDGWVITPPESQTLYWIGGSGEWGVGNHWSHSSGGVTANCVPTAADDVVFDVVSGFEDGDNTVEITSQAFCNNMTWEDAPGNPLLLGKEHQRMNIFGSLQMQEAMEVDLSTPYFQWNFYGTAGEENTIETRGQELAAGDWNAEGGLRGFVSFRGAGNEWRMVDDLSVGDRNIELLGGTLNTNENKLTFRNLSSFYTAVRALLANNSQIHSSGIIQFGISNYTLDLTGTTVDVIGSLRLRGTGSVAAGQSTINLNGHWGTLEIRDKPDRVLHDVHFTRDEGHSARLVGHNTTFNDVSFQYNAIIGGSNTYNNLSFAAGSNNQLESGQKQTINGQLTASGNPCFITHLRSTSETPAEIVKLEADTILVDYITIDNMIASGGASFLGTANATPRRNTDGWDFDATPGDYIFGFGPARTLDCDEMPYTITTEVFNPNPGTSFFWGDGSAGPELVVEDFGIYTVDVFYADFCSISDTIELISPPFPEADLGADRFLEPGGAVILDAGAGEEYSYLWSTGDTVQTITVSEHGLYWVVVTNRYRCEAYAEVLVYGNAVVETALPDGITLSSALVGGEVVSDGASEVTGRGIYWGTTGHDLPADGEEVALGTGTGTFSTELSDLDPNTTYYVMAYATNQAGTSFGAAEPFTTLTDVPAVETSIPSSVTASSALVGGEVVSDGGADITGRGIFWGTGPDPAETGTEIPVGNGTGMFETILEDLEANTLYHVVAYATNSEGTSLGETKEFTTLSYPPVVITAPPGNITTYSAVIGGEVIDDGNSPVTERGLYWGTDDDPAESGQWISMGDGLGTFEIELHDLIPQTHYYVVASATSDAGTGFGDVIVFATDDIDRTVFVPNAFVPSGLGENQVFMPVFDENPVSYSMSVFNRWGEEIFFTNDVDTGWDGRINNAEAPQGSYTYRIQYGFDQGEDRQLFGIVLLIR